VRDTARFLEADLPEPQQTSWRVIRGTSTASEHAHTQSRIAKREAPHKPLDAQAHMRAMETKLESPYEDFNHRFHEGYLRLKRQIPITHYLARLNEASMQDPKKGRLSSCK
jgi:hypothetical protein